MKQRRKLDKFIPSADTDFALTARNFVESIRIHRDSITLPAPMFEQLEEAVQAFRDAYAKVRAASTRTRVTILGKNAAREEAERLVRETANIIRADPSVSTATKMLLRIQGLPRRAGETTCPQRAPMLRFLGSGDGVSDEAGIGGGSGVHVLEYRDVEVAPRTGSTRWRKTRPSGAARLELYFDFVPPGQPIPQHPAELSGWPRYLRSYTKNRIEVTVPRSHSGPMLVVYWARWAGATGDVGPFSRTCVARWEGANVALPCGVDQPVQMLHETPVHQKALPATEANGPVRTQFVFVNAPQLQLPASQRETVEQAA